VRVQKSSNGTPKPAATKRDPRAPVPPSFTGVLIRAVIVAGLFYPYLVYLAKETPAAAAVVTGIAFALMIPLGMVLDRWRFRFQTNRLEKARAAKAGKPGGS
jgi:hypothetical protein